MPRRCAKALALDDGLIRRCTDSWCCGRRVADAAKLGGVDAVEGHLRRRAAMAMTTSSSDGVAGALADAVDRDLHLARAAARTAASELATARPRSSWHDGPTTTAAPGRRARRYPRVSSANSDRGYGVADGVGDVDSVVGAGVDDGGVARLEQELAGSVRLPRPRGWSWISASGRAPRAQADAVATAAARRLLAGHAELVREVEVRGGEEGRLEARALGAREQRLPGGVRCRSRCSARGRR